MADLLENKLIRVENLIAAGLDAAATGEILQLIEGPKLSPAILDRVMLYNETLPRAADFPYTPQQRYLHFLWDVFDKTAFSLIVPFSIPFRRLIGKHLFKACGQAMIAEENVRFNFGHLLELGDGVFFNRGVFLDTKGGIIIGNSVALAEDVRIFTHNHSEASHIERSYGQVLVGNYVKIYAGATIMPGVTIGSQAIVAAGAMVNQNVPPNMVVAGIPARIIRERNNEGRTGDELDHIWLF
ncbi:MAG: Galactoside O-acetyltransferase [Smithella sp. PtaU1.Bin162]|nr:MAG: Galactoside O-acetyltransferase [Smithella sp. PtaU1.Bin162]